MRLIDADDFESKLENSCTTESETEAFVNFLAYMDEQPTVIDLDTVIEELQLEANLWRSSAREYNDEKEYGHVEGIEDSIRVIKRFMKR